eukprot:gnl/TRDRNA2_/TRDRNA2_134771_c0_seq1.p1 gnl/TRDRNA2_/TRDRNA2_134771_c0~~gnl/TRDRNA2_/TRDRNA2_134771_c0_seq1.p1  ORF type:complete len:286 (+),score=43.96 gnl/TRDRNA2_/TRDRNA2_134771_c0_seq1:99-956(+)
MKRLEYMKIAVAMLLEIKRGNESFYFPYLRHLPSPDAYRQFHPFFASSSLLADFQALLATKHVRGFQDQRGDMVACFQAWQEVSAIPELKELSFADIEYGYFLVRTRSAAASGRTVMVPAHDLMNVARLELINAHYTFGHPTTADVPENASFSVYRNRASKAIEAGGELYESYCGKRTDCHNSKFVEIWGVFLEENDLPESEKWRALRRGQNCSALTDPGATAGSLREAAEAALDLATAFPSHAVAPRCKPSIRNSSEQGGIRCSFARLAWQRCGSEWGDPRMEL